MAMRQGLEPRRPARSPRAARLSQSRGLVMRTKRPTSVDAEGYDTRITRGWHRQRHLETRDIRHVPRNKRDDGASHNCNTDDARALVRSAAESFRCERKNRRKHDRIEKANRKKCAA